MIHRYRATDKHMKYTEGADPLNYWGLMHFGMASNMMEGQLRSRGGPQIELPFIILSSPNDTHVNSMGSHDMFQQCTSKDKTLVSDPAPVARPDLIRDQNPREPRDDWLTARPLGLSPAHPACSVVDARPNLSVHVVAFLVELYI